MSCILPMTPNTGSPIDHAPAQHKLKFKASASFQLEPLVLKNFWCPHTPHDHLNMRTPTDHTASTKLRLRGVIFVHMCPPSSSMTRLMLCTICQSIKFMPGIKGNLNSIQTNCVLQRTHQLHAKVRCNNIWIHWVH